MNVATNKRIRLGDLLVQKGLITEDQLMRALKEQRLRGTKLGETLISMGFVSELAIVKILCDQLHIEYVELRNMKLDEAAVYTINETIAKKYNLIPIGFDKDNPNMLRVAMSDPMDFMAIDDIAIITNFKVLPVLSTSSQIAFQIDRYFGRQSVIAVADQYKKEQGRDEAVRDAAKGEASLTDTSPIVVMVRSIIEQAVRQRASDIHIEALENKVRVRYRIDGALYERMVYDNSLLPAISTRIKILGGMDISEKRKPQDGRMSIMVDRQDYDIRISSLPTVHGEKIVMRLSSKLNLTRNKKDLGLPPDEMERFNHMLASPFGIILVTGPTGSGKSTTLYTALSELNKEAVNIVTVEDPVEADIEGINQVQVNNKVELNFASALRSILRQDPDIIMIGEIRDRETAAIAVQASITGHLVVSTLHTNNAVGTLNRMADMGVERYLIADSVVGVIAQRLVRKLCSHCKKMRPATSEEKRVLRMNTQEEVNVYEPCGCDFCSHTGYYGRIGVFEIMEVNDEIRDLIAENGTTEELERAARNSGMRTLRDNGISYVLNGTTSVEEMLKASYE